MASELRDFVAASQRMGQAWLRLCFWPWARTETRKAQQRQSEIEQQHQKEVWDEMSQHAHPPILEPIFTPEVMAATG